MKKKRACVMSVMLAMALGCLTGCGKQADVDTEEASASEESELSAEAASNQQSSEQAAEVEIDRSEVFALLAGMNVGWNL